MISFISSFKIINAVIPDPNIFLSIAGSVADVAAFNPNGIKTILASGLGTFFIKGKPGFTNVAKSLPKNSADFTILGN